jgi:hypothetical protein
MGEGVFIGPKSSGRQVLRAYFQCLFTVVQRLFHMIRYYTVDSVNSAMYVRPKVAYVHCTIHIVRLYYLLNCMSGRGPPYVRAKRQQRMSANPNVRLH